MANQDEFNLIRHKGPDHWNLWRSNIDHLPDLSRADLRGADLVRADLSGTDLRGAKLNHADLTEAVLAGAKLGPFSLDIPNRNNPGTTRTRLRTDLTAANLSKADLTSADLHAAIVAEADFTAANLVGANLGRIKLNRVTLTRANLVGLNLSGLDLQKADLSRANLSNAVLIAADLRGADLSQAVLVGADLSDARLVKADLSDAILTDARMVRTNLAGCSLVSAKLDGADLSGAVIYGVSAWNVSLKNAKQDDLVITPPSEPAITVDDLEVAQFIYLLLNNEKIRRVIDTITSKVVLILGRFTPDRKPVLDAIRNALRSCNYLPVLFDFDCPRTRSTLETVTTLARLARFIVADITDPRSIPQELTAIVPTLPSVPIQPILLSGAHPWGMYDHIARYPWVLPIQRYESSEQLLDMLKDRVIQPAETAVRDNRAATTEAQRAIT
jgi:uncharacterized protein YjbI with pentapeptide repeats